MEFVDVIVKDQKITKHYLTTTEKEISVPGCRLLKAFICFGKMPGVKRVMNTVSDDHE